ncbi:MAG: diguanylate cyclase/phosphodiesterase [Proteobacteria bacterium]|nr:diguanylate cyclase/phosphodiesterase [Pseudomonadota bacterium]
MNNMEAPSACALTEDLSALLAIRQFDPGVLSGEILRAIQPDLEGGFETPALADALAGLARHGWDGLADFERTWRAALLAGAPASLAAEGVRAWLVALTREPMSVGQLAAVQALALHVAGRAAELVRQTVSCSDARQTLAELLRAAAPGAQTGVLILHLPAFLEALEDPGGPWQVELVQAVMARLRPGDWFLQSSAHEWLLLMPELRSATQLPLAAQAFSTACTEVLALHFGLHQNTLCVGAALAPEDGQSAPELLFAARTAAMHARTRGETFGRFQPERGALRDDQELGLEFARALQSNALLLHFQPQVCLGQNQCIAVEALLRWRNAKGIWVSPPYLISLAERLGLLPRLCDWLIAEACRQLSVLSKAGFSLRVAINLTARDFYDVDLPARVKQLALTWGVNPQQLVIEVTETTLIAQPQRALGVFEALRALGCRISLDDFGTGNSSLAYLRELPVDEIKIDRCFVADVLESSRSAAIVRSVIALGRGLGLNVVAEGAEHEAVIAWLRDEGCSVVQGFGFARPMSSEALLEWLRSRPDSVRA